MNSVTSILMKKIVKQSANVIREGVSLAKIRSINDGIVFNVKLERNNGTRNSSFVQETELNFPQYYTKTTKTNTFLSESQESDFDLPVSFQKDTLNMNADF